MTEPNDPNDGAETERTQVLSPTVHHDADDSTDNSNNDNGVNTNVDTNADTNEEEHETEHHTASPFQEYKAFLRVFLRSNGGPQLVLLIFILSAALGAIVGVVPDVMGDRYARLRYGWDGPECSTFDAAHKPPACISGSDESQSSAARAEFVKNLLTLFLNTAIASWSDTEGRKGAWDGELCSGERRRSIQSISHGCC